MHLAQVWKVPIEAEYHPSFGENCMRVLQDTTQRLHWAGKFLRQGKSVASLTPSSRWLAKALCRYVDAAVPQTIVELGAGMGPVTEMALRRMHPRSTLLSIEMDPELHAMATARCPGADVQLGSAADLDRFLDDRGITSVDCLISCLPVPSMPKQVNRGIFDCWRRRCGGVFTQLTQIPWLYRRMYQRVFDRVDFDLVLLNFLPGGVYHCSGLREDFEDESQLPGH